MMVNEIIHPSQATDLLEGLIPKRDDKGTLPAPHLEKLFIFALMWSLGALLELEDRAKMEAFMAAHQSKLCLPPVKDDETIFEYLVDEKGICIPRLVVYMDLLSSGETFLLCS